MRVLGFRACCVWISAFSSAALFAACGSADEGLFSAAGSSGVDGSTTGGTAGGDGAATGGSAGSGATGGSAGSAATGGSDGSACPDNDADGETTCAGDCDDADPNNFSTNTEACGDGVDNNCDTNADENCQGIGTFVSQLVGDDSNPGTQQSPVQTIAEGIAHAQQIGNGADVYVAEGDYPEKVTLVEGISLLGGYRCNTSTCDWQRDSAQYLSNINAQDAEGVLADATITRVTRLDGFVLNGQDGAGVGDGRSTLHLAGGTPIVANNSILGPNVGGGDYRTGRSFGILVQSSNDTAGALIESNDIRGGRSESNSSDALALDWAAATTSYAVIRQNRIRAGEGRVASGVTVWNSGAGTLLEQNEIYAGTCTGTTGHTWAVTVGGTLDVLKNQINTDATRVGSCATTEFSGGINSESSTSNILNNVIRGVSSPRSVGVMLGEFERAAGRVILNANIIDGSAPGGSSTAGTRSHALVLTIGPCTGCGFNAYVGRIRNNILVAGVAEQRFVVYETGPSLKTQEPEALENNLFWLGASPGTGSALYREWNGSAQTLHTTIAAVNAMSIPSGTPALNIEGDPLLDATGHLGAGSPAIDKGTATEAPSDDIDGDARPQGSAVDIGADELVP